MDVNERRSRRRAKASTLVIVDLVLLLLILGAAVHTAFFKSVRGLDEALQGQRSFLQGRADKLCGEVVPSAPYVPALPEEQLTFLPRLTQFADHVWREYDKCQQPIEKPIPESLLHFKTNQPAADTTDTDDEDAIYEPDTNTGKAYRTIYGYVDENIGQRNQIYVLGHTDERGDEPLNYGLSYRRALKITNIIRRHLAAAGKVEGRDYTIYPVGMGEAKPVGRQPGQDTLGWYKDCRRIELIFRSQPVGLGAGAQM